MGERFKAWTHGPVLPAIWKSRDAAEARDPRSVTVPELDPFTDRLLDLVIEEYGHLSGRQLSAMTHQELPWRQARGGLSAGEPSSAPSGSEADHADVLHRTCSVWKQRLRARGAGAARG